MSKKIKDLVIIGGGVMGLFTAYYAAELVDEITILEKSYVGNPLTASFSRTRSIRNDYLDPFYARLAYEARQLWLEFQRAAAEPCLLECGCLNIAKEDVTPALEETYAIKSFRTLSELHLRSEALDQGALKERFPQFVADLGRLDVEAGLLYVPAVTQRLQEVLREKKVRIVEHVEVEKIEQQAEGVTISSSAGEYTARKLVVTAGLGTNEILQRMPGCRTHFPLQPDRPSQCKYFIPPEHKRAQFTSDVLPVFAYLDVGIYGHPIYAGKTPGVKIGFYNPPDIQKLNTQIRDVHSFVEACMPELQDAEAVDVQDVDQCFYDLVADDNFILGEVPEYENVYVGVGWRGTGYKYAPWIGRVLMQLALQAGTTYDISSFSPARFR
ncbi:FAD-dependent oxidoreductase [Ktedonosporobacter rubrisoli]|uniref:FAD-dependent oxidoreductase n=1 Tax=Ktedonosporobacter rubrisoli TaxID=2509675 RepID=A0A4P6JTY5_KTERU|nr:FAD-dependent oxidoreductase [Ktedonosporobacter rubrisoli]QBD78783.1 FAD-dependent oxidoreductase [Ktedonosporobacter rubrisoli]